MNNLLISKDIEIRINRSIQVEGTFGQLKQNMNYERVRRYLNSLEHSVFKNNCWYTPDYLKPEIFTRVKQKKKDY